MTKEEFCQAQQQLGFQTNAEFSEALGVSVYSVNRYRTGGVIPITIVKLIRLMIRVENLTA